MLEQNSNQFKDIKQTPNEFMRINLLAKREYVLESIHLYLKEINKGTIPSIYQVKSSIQSVMLEIDCALQEELSVEDYQKINYLLNSSNSNEVLASWDMISRWLYEKELTRVFKRIDII